MIKILPLILLSLTGCAKMIPGFEAALDDYVTDEAVNITVDKAAMQNDTDIDISVKILNKDVPVPTQPPIINIHPTVPAKEGS